MRHACQILLPLSKIRKHHRMWYEKNVKTETRAVGPTQTSVDTEGTLIQTPGSVGATVKPLTQPSPELVMEQGKGSNLDLQQNSILVPTPHHRQPNAPTRSLSSTYGDSWFCTMIISFQWENMAQSSITATWVRNEDPRACLGMPILVSKERTRNSDLPSTWQHQSDGYY